jgi:hypothetical protein
MATSKPVNLIKSPGIAGGAFLLLAGVAILFLVLGSGGLGKIGMMFIGVTILAAVVINYQKIINQLNGLGA